MGAIADLERAAEEARARRSRWDRLLAEEREAGRTMNVIDCEASEEAMVAVRLAERAVTRSREGR